MSKKLGERIAEYLKKNNMRQKELAKCVGVSVSAMSRYVSGDRDPKPDVLANIAITLHVSSDYLLGIAKQSDTKRSECENPQKQKGFQQECKKNE